MPNYLTDLCVSVLLVGAVVCGGLLALFLNWWLCSTALRWLLGLVNNC
jgi:hypothetical protein